MKSKEKIIIGPDTTEEEIAALVKTIATSGGYTYDSGFFRGLWYCRQGQWFWRPITYITCYIFGHKVEDGSDCYRCG